MESEMIEIVEKIEKDSEKLKKLVEIDEMEDLYKLFKENGYIRSFSCFQGEIMCLLERTGAALKIEQLEDIDYDSISGGKHTKDKWTKYVSTAMASLLALSSPLGGASVQAAPTLPSIKTAAYFTAVVGIPVGLLCVLGYLYYRSEKKLAARLSEHYERMGNVLDEIRQLYYYVDSHDDSYMKIFQNEPAIRRLLCECMACLYHFPRVFRFTSTFVNSKHVLGDHKKEYIYNREGFQSCINRCKEIAEKYRRLGRRYEQEKSISTNSDQNSSGRSNGVSVNVNVYNAQTPNSVFPTDNNRIVNNTNMPCDKEQCEEWAKLINKVVQLAEYIARCEKSSPIRFKYVAPPPPPPPTPKPQTLSPGAQSGGRNFSRY